VQRWHAGNGRATADRRPDADRPTPAHALSEAERARIVAVANEPRFTDMPPARIVPTLADEGTYPGKFTTVVAKLRPYDDRSTGSCVAIGRHQPVS
jgi:hypothetical protein